MSTKFNMVVFVGACPANPHFGEIKSGQSCFSGVAGKKENGKAPLPRQGGFCLLTGGLVRHIFSDGGLIRVSYKLTTAH